MCENMTEQNKEPNVKTNVPLVVEIAIYSTRNGIDDEVADDAHAFWWKGKLPRIKEEHDGHGKLAGRYLF